MKAWLVQFTEDPYEEGNSGLVFAETREQAKYKSDLYGEFPWETLRATRLPQFDNLEGKITDRLLLENNWIVECHKCGRQISGIDEDYTCFDALNRVYCSQECLSKEED